MDGATRPSSLCVPASSSNVHPKPRRGRVRAVWELRKQGATKSRGELVTLPKVGLQLLDVVTVSDDRCGISSELYRVRGIEEVYDATKHPLIYRQRVTSRAR